MIASPRDPTTRTKPIVNWCKTNHCQQAVFCSTQLTVDQSARSVIHLAIIVSTQFSPVTLNLYTKWCANYARRAQELNPCVSDVVMNSIIAGISLYMIFLYFPTSVPVFSSLAVPNFSSSRFPALPVFRFRVFGSTTNRLSLFLDFKQP